jgi:hypothetical protein
MRLINFDIYYPSYHIRVPDDLNNETEFKLHTTKSFEEMLMYNFEKAKGTFGIGNYKYIKEKLESDKIAEIYTILGPM